MTPECPREPEVLDAAMTGRWPELVGDDLRDHVYACGVCRDLAEVTAIYAREREELPEKNSLPAPGLVWWRTNLRIRREAADAARRATTFIHLLILSCFLAGMLVALVPFALTHPGWFSAMAGGLAPLDASAILARWGVFLLLGLGGAALIVFVPFAAWLLTDDR